MRKSWIVSGICIVTAFGAGLGTGWSIWRSSQHVANPTPVASSDPEPWREPLEDLQAKTDALLATLDRPLETSSAAAARQAEMEERLDHIAGHLEVQTRLVARLAAAEDAKYQRAMQAGIVLHADGRHAEAVAALAAAIELRPELFNAYLLRGAAHMELRDWEHAIADFTVASQLNPESPDPRNNLAWIRATCPDERFRDGAAAVELATTACEMTLWKNPSQISTLAAAYAEQGDFESAIRWQKECLEFAEGEQADDFRKALAQYERKEPLRTAARE